MQKLTFLRLLFENSLLNLHTMNQRSYFLRRLYFFLYVVLIYKYSLFIKSLWCGRIIFPIILIAYEILLNSLELKLTVNQIAQTLILFCQKLQLAPHLNMVKTDDDYRNHHYNIEHTNLGSPRIFSLSLAFISKFHKVVIVALIINIWQLLLITVFVVTVNAIL